MNVTLVDKISDGAVNTAQMLGSWISDHGINIAFILVLAWFMHRFGAKLVKRIISRTVRPDIYPTKADREKRIKTLESLSSAVVRVGVYVLAFILIVGEINPGYTTALFASAGLVTVALGFGAKDLISDFTRGVFIITENQYRVGDIVELAGVEGVIVEVTIRTTVLRDFNGDVHHVPNGIIGVTTNKTMSYSGINEDITVVHETDIERVKHVINHVGEQLARKPEFESKIVEPPTFSGITGYSGIIVKFIAKVRPGDAWDVKTGFYVLLDKAFKANDIQLAGPLVVAHTPADKPKPGPRKKPA